jgi:hypothetical protein
MPGERRKEESTSGNRTINEKDWLAGTNFWFNLIRISLEYDMEARNKLVGKFNDEEQGD